MRKKDRFTSRAGRAGAGLMLLLTGLVASLAVGTTAASATTTPAWQQVTPATNPPALVAPSMAYDAATHQLVLTGEVPSDTTNETWVWSGSDWNQLTPQPVLQRAREQRWPTTPTPVNSSSSAG